MKLLNGLCVTSRHKAPQYTTGAVLDPVPVILLVHSLCVSVSKPVELRGMEAELQRQLVIVFTRLIAQHTISFRIMCTGKDQRYHVREEVLLSKAAHIFIDEMQSLNEIAHNSN